MSVGYESTVVNGQLIPIAPMQAFAPLTFGSAYTGPGMWPRNGVYNVPPVVPSAGTWEGSNGGAGGGPMDNYGGATLPTWAGASKTGGANPFHPTKSPLLWAVGFLVVGLWALHSIHYK